jgi:hypothetical protein
VKRAAALAAVFLGLLLGSGAARADTPAASYATSGCAGAPVWRIGYRVWGAASDQTNDEPPAPKLGAAALPEAEKQARLLAEQVGPMSACGVRIAIDVYDLTGATWQFQTYKGPNGWTYDEVAPDALAFRDAHGYDSVFDAYPVGGIRGYLGLTYMMNRVSLFPVMPVSYVPSYLVLMHEWLHQVVWFYRDVAWPTDDVHGACEHGYTGGPCGEIPAYFADLLQGKVAENGQLLGIRPGDWLRDGTPAHLKPISPISPVRPSPAPPISPFSVSGFDLPASVDASGNLYNDQLAATVFTFETNRPPQQTPKIWLESFDYGWKQVGSQVTSPAFDGSRTHGSISLAQLAPDGLGTGAYRVAWSFPESPTVSGASKSFNVFERPLQLRSVTVVPRISLGALRSASVSIVLDRPGEIDVRVDRLVGSRWRVVWWHSVDSQQETKLPLAAFVTTANGTRAGSYRILVATQGTVPLDAAPSASFTLVRQ